MEILWGHKAWLKASAFYLRYQIFVLEQGIKPTEEFDALDDNERIYGVAFVAGQPVATIRWQLDSPSQLHPDRFCVAKEYRRQGIGKTLFTELEKRGVAAGCKTSLLSAEMTAAAFYQKLGYQIVSKPFYEDGILCVSMKKDLLETNE